MNKIGKVIKKHVSEFPVPLILKRGEILKVEDRETQWQGWLFCQTLSGHDGWVPKNYLIRRGNHAIILRDYDAAELNVNPGEILQILDEEAGWYLCRTQSNETGWIPKENIEVTD